MCNAVELESDIDEEYRSSRFVSTSSFLFYAIGEYANSFSQDSLDYA